MAWSARPSMPAGHKVTATDWDAVLDRIEALSSPPFAVKSADESLNTNTTVQNDDHLSITLGASANYTIDGLLIIEGATGADWKGQFTFTTGSGNRLDIGFIGADAAATTVSGDGYFGFRVGNTSSPTSTFIIGTNTSLWVTTQIKGYATVGATPMALTLQWAQNASSGTNTIVKAGSWLRATQVMT